MCEHFKIQGWTNQGREDWRIRHRVRLLGRPRTDRTVDCQRARADGDSGREHRLTARSNLGRSTENSDT